jgi:RNA polymerase sigma-70 factor (ECF subfamily)
MFGTLALANFNMPDRAAPATGSRENLGDLRRLYADHADFVRRVVLKLGGPSTDADDLMQEVFLVALHRMDSLQDPSLARSWLYGISVRVVAAARRRAKLRRVFSLDEGHEPQAMDTPVSAFEKREASEKVYRLLDKISEKKRSVFIMYELEGMSGEEIAAVVGCPVKTVWTRLHHARKEFLAKLEREDKLEPNGRPIEQGGR